MKGGREKIRMTYDEGERKNDSAKIIFSISSKKRLMVKTNAAFLQSSHTAEKGKEKAGESTRQLGRG